MSYDSRFLLWREEVEALYHYSIHLPKNTVERLSIFSSTSYKVGR